MRPGKSSTLHVNGPGSGRVCVVNGDLNGRSFFDTFGNEIQPGQHAWLQPAHARALNEKNRFWTVDNSNQ